MIDLYPCTERCYRCKAKSWECIGEFVPNRGPPEDVLACAFCGVRLRVPARPREERPPPRDTDEFRFQYGRFKGMTLAEADAEPNGRRYLEVMRDRNDKLKERITEYLTAHAAPSA